MPSPNPTATPGSIGNDTSSQPDWSIQDAIDTYNIDRWGMGYFGINDAGNVTVDPEGNKSACIDVMKVVEEAADQGLVFPMLIRFQDLLRDRVVTLNKAFQQAIQELNYQGKYCGVFPIKVNQLREVVEEILDAGRPYNYGVEAGSKPELYAALAVHDNPEALIVCNGYKDTQFIRMALLGTRLGKKVIMVAEKSEEVRAIVEVAREMGVEPMIGIRLRLAAKSGGMWATSGGESAKFGLSTLDLVDMLHYLQSENLSHVLRLVHFHIGSQVPDILSIKSAVREGTRYYAKIRAMGFEKLDYIDAGGGLGVDYDGSRTSFHSSTNYTLEEYAADIIDNVMDVCEEEKVPHPHIVTESGRAIVAHHSMLVVEVFGVIEKTRQSYDLSIGPDEHKWVRQLNSIRERITTNPMEALHDTQQIKNESQSAFDLGYLDLETRAKIETFYFHIVEEIVELFKRRAAATHGKERIPEEIADMTAYFADQYLCNFSVFQSLLDHWAVGQIFPVMPVHRLNERPEALGTIVDITCDSDGKICKFADIANVRDALPLHLVEQGERYYLGIFMTGAYQDIMGDLHNLFGRLNEVHVFLDPDEDEGWYIEETLPGHTIAQVLEMTQYGELDLARRMKQQVDDAIKSDRIRPNEGMRLLAEYERGLKSPTYLSLRTQNGNGGN